VERDARDERGAGRGDGQRQSPLRVAIAGGGLRAASMLRLLNEVESLVVVGLAAARSAPALRLADEVGVFTTTDVSELYQLPGLDVIIDMAEDPVLREHLLSQKPETVEVIGARGSELVWDLLIAKKRGEEQEKLFVELQVAYDKIRSHERRLQTGKEALETANRELEGRLAEIFFNHEFFKALTSYSSVDDVTSLIVDGANGILGAEIACVYLFDQSEWTLRLRASQGRPEDLFRPGVPVSETILGRAFRDGFVQEEDVADGAESAEWFCASGEIRSHAALPLRSGDAIVGVLAVAGNMPRELDATEVDRFVVIGNQSALALQNALLHEELERLSVTDGLTEMYNHGYLMQRLEEEIGRAERFRHRLGVIMLDIDGFKEFNDTYGHPRGDRVLQAVSAIIRENLRDIDVAARYGGEEFVVVLPETDAEGARAVGERIRAGVAACAFVGGEGLPPVHKTVSVGVAVYPDDAVTQARLIETVDRAMYEAKRAGKNRVVLASR